MAKTGGRAATWRRSALIVIALVVINLPWVLTTWRQHQVSSDGIRVTATITASRISGGDASIQFTLPASLDPDQTVRSATIDQKTFAATRQSQRIGARVLRGDPAAYRLDGEVRSNVGGIATLIGDAFVLLIALLGFRFGGRMKRPALIALALGDVAEGGPEPMLDQQSDGTYLICGQVKEAGDDSLVLALGDRDVTVHLQGHANPVASDASAQVRAQLVG